jgi:hypothetical protein
MSVRSFFRWLKEVFMSLGGMSQEAAMTNLSIRLKVKVEADNNGSSWGYAIKSDNSATDPYVKNGKIELGQGPGSGAEIEFRLQGKAGQRLDFNVTDPIWVQVGSCPTQPGFPNGVSVIGCTTERLTIEDLNLGAAADLHYRLNFIDGNGDELSWDPVIRNGGGGP